MLSQRLIWKKYCLQLPIKIKKETIDHLIRWRCCKITLLRQYYVYKMEPTGPLLECKIRVKHIASNLGCHECHKSFSRLLKSLSPSISTPSDIFFRLSKPSWNIHKHFLVLLLHSISWLYVVCLFFAALSSFLLTVYLNKTQNDGVFTWSLFSSSSAALSTSLSRTSFLWRSKSDLQSNKDSVATSSLLSNWLTNATALYFYQFQK